ncbi:uncharacterized protein LOC119013024 isoform X5 [Acanthopagrus latus]|uniref:uncharacterized protein LOC119013024 isoform X5 n=1 Tax=Acanthopagrus latus TaxID=8177 RepID=UPI00187CACA3|nr:uncharacterized protein LOC119013024 isoform X5 [Acanthopagrus latus]
MLEDDGQSNPRLQHSPTNRLRPAPTFDQSRRRNVGRSRAKSERSRGKPRRFAVTAVVFETEFEATNEKSWTASEMATSSKSHKAMADSEWMSRLRKFASSGVWPAGEGNRPAPRQKKWFALYQMIERCPMQRPGQRSLFGQERQCVCHFHTQRGSVGPQSAAVAGSVQGSVGPQSAAAAAAGSVPGSVGPQSAAAAGSVPGSVGPQSAAAAGSVPGSVGPQSAAAAGSVPGSVGPQSAAAAGSVPGSVGPQSAAAGQQSAAVGQVTAGHKQRLLNLSMFTKPRFGGAHVAAAKPNLSRARKATETQVVSPTKSCTSSPASIAVSSPDIVTDAPGPVPVLSTTAVCATVTAAQPRTETSLQLPRLWSEGLPPADHKWIEKYVLKMGPRGKLELQDNLKLWYYPPQPSPLYHQAPAPDRFFAHPLLVWMPYKLWKVRVVCPNPACGRHQLTGAGLHKRARRVLDVDRIYNMVTETLTCTKCRANHVSWSQTVLKQLDLAHRSEFRVILTQKFACDIRVIRLLRERGLGNSPTRVLKQLRENHTEEWLHRVARYTTECVDFLQRPGLLPMAFPEPPEPAVVPSCKWLLSVYSQDILTRLEDIKARITSIYGNILKMDSTKKITKKLAGTAKGTALWLTSVGNEYGQILMSVLTAQEGTGLDMMAADLVKRYQQAGVDPPVILYVDCGCCAEAVETKLKVRFSGWPDLTVRLDIWHFMRRLALGCTTDAHQLYPVFMSRLSSCLFEWDAADLALLREAKKQQLQSQGRPCLTDGDISRHLSREELALHCRRRTRGEETTTKLLEELLQGLMGDSGNDSLGVPLFDRERMQHIWHVQKKHIKCIQDLPGVALYTKTGELTKGGLRLPTYRCARGSTSLESFHLHLNRFIPGTSANSLNFQAYLLEGLHRWNQDRGSAALSTTPSPLRSYSGDLLHCVNKNFETLFGKKVAPEFCPPSRYTGELIGLQYLFRQTGQALQDMHPDSEETAELIEQHEDDVETDEGFADIPDDPTVADLEVPAASLTPAPSSSLVSTVSTLVITTSGMAPGTSTLSVGTSSAVFGSSTIDTALPPGTSVLAIRTSSMASGASIMPSTSSAEAGVDMQAEDEDMAVDDQNIPGYQHVDRLAEYLVKLREQTSLYLTNQQTSAIIALWEKLDEGDKQRVIYAARHQGRLLSGRFRTPKKPSQTPGVESTTRCMLGASSAPAQWPNCCRLVENIFIRLCDLHQGPVRKGKGADSRWSLILRDYHKIRQLVVGNSLVMQGSEIQLVEVNQNTLIQWHNSRQKRQELSVLLQGTVLPPALPESEEPLQEARALPAEPRSARHEHQYHLPESTAGQAQQRPTASSHPIMPKAPVKRLVLVMPPAPQIATATGQILPHFVTVALPAPVQGTNPQITEPNTTAESGPPPKRPYRRTVEANTCKRCGQFRTAETGHSQYRGRVYCPAFDTLTKQQWLEEMRKKFSK